jgi:2-polyprenyl-3-methyl-5-hydroxy-6-metoxy-1,4-benzoquinol methylase
MKQLIIEGRAMNYDLKPIAAQCPVCAAEEGLLLYSVNNLQSAQHFILKEKYENIHAKLANHIKKLWGSDHCKIIRCSNCSFCYANPYVAGDDEFYYYIYSRSTYQSTWKWEHQTCYEILKRMKEEGKLNNFRLLDIGAGDGVFVKKIAPCLTDKKDVVCTEYSDYCVSKIMEYGITCIKSDIRTLADQQYDSFFDVVCLFQVLPALDNNMLLFDRLKRITKRNANIFISVPNPDWITFNEINGGLLDMPPYHIGRWNKESFKRICQAYSWKLDKYEIEPDYFNGKLRSFILQKYSQKRQMKNSLANYIGRLKNKRIEKVFSIFPIIFDILWSAPQYRQLMSNHLGKAALIHIQT